MVPDAETGSRAEAAAKRRQRRVEEKRLLILRSTLELIDEGHLDPTISQVVERSGVPERTIFRHFDKEKLTVNALQLAAERLGALASIPAACDGPLDRRIVNLVEHRVLLLSRMHNPGRAARFLARDSPELKKDMVQNAERLRGSYATYFASELADLDAGEREDLLDAITALMTFEGYEALRERLHRADDQIARAWGTALHRLLG